MFAFGVVCDSNGSVELVQQLNGDGGDGDKGGVEEVTWL